MLDESLIGPISYNPTRGVMGAAIVEYDGCQYVLDMADANRYESSMHHLACLVDEKNREKDMENGRENFEAAHPGVLAWSQD